jgi:competence protein ComEA
LGLVVLGAAVIGIVMTGQGHASLEVTRASTTMASTTVAASSQTASETVAATDSLRTICVHVDGAVAVPGVYDLVGGTLRIRDAVAAAGGLADDADTSAVNLAQLVQDAEKVHVPAVGEEPVAASQGASTGSAATGSSSTSSSLVNINSADLVALETLPGVGEATATAIIKDREENGPFSSPEDIMRVTGIAEKKYEKLKDGICV